VVVCTWPSSTHTSQLSGDVSIEAVYSDSCWERLNGTASVWHVHAVVRGKATGRRSAKCLSLPRSRPDCIQH